MLEIIGKVYQVCHLHTDETTRTRGIRERLGLVGGADERGIAAVLFISLAVRRAELHVSRREQILQQDLLPGCRLVKLVDVDQRK